MTSGSVTAGLEVERADVGELPVAAGRPPAARHRAASDPLDLGHQAPLAARNPASRSARMSSMCSMPTASRTRPGVTPVAELLLGGQLAVRGRRRVDHQAAHVADVGHVAVQLQRLDEPLAGLEAALDLEGEHGAGALRQRTSRASACHGLDARPA